MPDKHESKEKQKEPQQQAWKTTEEDGSVIIKEGARRTDGRTDGREGKRWGIFTGNTRKKAHPPPPAHQLAFFALPTGSARIRFPSDNSVFYNPVQQFNRDLSIAAINTWSKLYFLEKAAHENPSREWTEDEVYNMAEPDMTSEAYKDRKFTVLEALSATGLRSIRYANELHHVGSILANDLSPQAKESIEKNARDNKVDSIVKANCGDAALVMYQNISTKFDVIDLDPYGSATQFIDAAVQSVADGGLLCVTCTDMAVLCGSQPESCFVKYAGMPLPNSPFCHEMALRLVLNTIQTSAARYRRFIEPMASFSIDFYVRMFVRVYTGPQEAKKIAGRTSMVYQCIGCKTFVTERLGKSVEIDGAFKQGARLGPPIDRDCVHCGKRSHVGGPYYSGPIHNREFVARMLKYVKEVPESTFGTRPRMLGMLTVAFEELYTPFYYTLSALCGTVHCTSPRMIDICSAIYNLGFRVSLTHATAASLKTDAPPEAIWDIMRKWVENTLPKDDDKRAAVLAKRKEEADRGKHPKADPPSRSIKLVRYQENPTKNWGP
ncbi:N2,N2-dimethylguanosine tRNA methyltransferase, partial [Blyttiomyces helicus]